LIEAPVVVDPDLADEITGVAVADEGLPDLDFAHTLICIRFLIAQCKR
jgi:hypothetical protein